MSPAGPYSLGGWSIGAPFTGASMYPNDIRPLTSLRIGAAIWVLVYHFRDHLGLDLDRLGLVAKGYLGVDLFFILSGFILSHVYLSRVEEKRFNYGSFLWARLSRIYPVHLVTLAATMAIWLVAMKMGARFDPVAFDPKVLPQHLLLIHAWGTTPSVQWNFPSWSISAEWFAYLIFPVAAVLVLALRRVAWLAVALSLGLFFLMFWGVESSGLPALGSHAAGLHPHRPGLPVRRLPLPAGPHGRLAPPRGAHRRGRRLPLDRRRLEPSLERRGHLARPSAF